jgi:hypothetical protein
MKTKWTDALWGVAAEIGFAGLLILAGLLIALLLRGIGR